MRDGRKEGSSESLGMAAKMMSVGVSVARLSELVGIGDGKGWAGRGEGGAILKVDFEGVRPGSLEGDGVLVGGILLGVWLTRCLWK